MACAGSLVKNQLPVVGKNKHCMEKRKTKKEQKKICGGLGRLGMFLNLCFIDSILMDYFKPHARKTLSARSDYLIRDLSH